jgi:transposase
MEILQMSTKELSQLEVVQKLEDKRMSEQEASVILGLGKQQVKRLLKAYRTHGATGLVSRHRGRVSNNRLSEKVRKAALNLLKTRYQGFGPTLAHEKLSG